MTSRLTPTPRELINDDGRSFADELAELQAGLAALPNNERRAYRDNNALVIARHPAARLLVVAGPGAGKSYLFLERIKYWREEHEAPRIYVSTFVRKLVNDLLNEVETKLGEEVRKHVDGTTLHALARSILERGGGAGGLELRQHVKVISDRPWQGVVWSDVRAFHPSATGYRLEDLKTQYQDDQFSDDPKWVEVRATYDTLRSFYNAVGFADMIVSARQAIEENPGLVQHSFWIVDEFQDFNRAEEHLISALTHDAVAVLVAGDDEQALYEGLKGARPEIIVAYYGDPAFANAMLPYCSRCEYYICLAASAFMEHHRHVGAIAKSYLPLTEDPAAKRVQVVLTAAPSTAVKYLRRFLDEHRSELEAHITTMQEGTETDPFLLILSPDRDCDFLHRSAEDLFDLVSAWSPGASHRSPDYWLVMDYCIAAWHGDNFAVRKVLHHEGISVSAVHHLIVQARAEHGSFVQLQSDVIAAVMAKSREIAEVIEAAELSVSERAKRVVELLGTGDVAHLVRDLETHPISRGKAADQGEQSGDGPAALAAVELMTITGAKGLSAKHVIVLGCDPTNMQHTTPLQFYVALSRARKSLHLITCLRARGADAAHPYVYDIPEECCDYISFKQDGATNLGSRAQFEKKLRQVTQYRR